MKKLTPYVRFDGKRRLVAGSLIMRPTKPAGKFKQLVNPSANLCCNVCSMPIENTDYTFSIDTSSPPGASILVESLGPNLEFQILDYFGNVEADGPITTDLPLVSFLVYAAGQTLQIRKACSSSDFSAWDTIHVFPVTTGRCYSFQNTTAGPVSVKYYTFQGIATCTTVIAGATEYFCIGLNSQSLIERYEDVACYNVPPTIVGILTDLTTSCTNNGECAP